MQHSEAYVNAFRSVLKIQDGDKIKTMKYRDDSWDSVAHMVLMSEIENTFNIMLDIEDVVDFSSFERGKEILRKYDVEL